jgi:hypothetical protein
VKVVAHDVDVWVRAEGQTTVRAFVTDAGGTKGADIKQQVLIDRAPPVSRWVSTVPGPQGGFDVTIEVNDFFYTGNTHRDAAGVQELRFSLGGADQVIPFANANGTATIHVPLGGWTTLAYRAVDRAGNEEFPFKTLTFRPQLQIQPAALDIVAPVGGTGQARLVLSSVGQGTFSILSISTDSYYFANSPGCLGTSSA